MDLASGLVVGQRYRLERLLGEGGMGAVWAATHLVTRKPVALKFIKELDDATNPNVRRRFLREARAASAVNHPNVVQIHDILELDNGSPVMVMDLLEGESLGERLARDQKLSLPDVARLLAPVISAVGTAHAAGVVHRDLKPDNIFLVRLPDGGTDVKVLDFGIAKFVSNDLENQTAGGLTGTGAMLGTPYYMSPEQAFGENDIDHRADTWALGVILYECLTGARPVEGENIGQLIKVIVTGAIVPLEKRAPALPRDVTQLVSRMLSHKRDERPSDLREVLEILRKYGDVRATSFNGPRAVIAPASAPSLEPPADASPFARTTDASSDRSSVSVRSGSGAPSPLGPTLAETANPHEVSRETAPTRRLRPGPILGLASVLLVAGALFVRFFPASGSVVPPPSAAAASVPPPPSADPRAGALAQPTGTASGVVAAPAACAVPLGASALPAASSTKRVVHATVDAAAPPLSPSATAAHSAVLPGGVYGQTPF